MLTASEFLPLPKLDGFVLPAQIPLLLSSLLSMRDAPHIKVERKSEESIADSIYQLLVNAFMYHSDWIDPLNLTLNMPFWTRISEESGIERATARRLLMGLLDARREYNEQRPGEPYKDNLGYWADLLCEYQEELFKKHGLIYRPVTTIPQAANAKREPESDADEHVIKRRRFSETYSIASRPSKTHSAGHRSTVSRSVEPRSVKSRSAEPRSAESHPVRTYHQFRSEPQSPQSTDFPQPSADLLRRIQEAWNMKAEIADMEKRLPRILNDPEVYEQATVALEDFKKILDNKLKHIREEHREFLNQAGPFDDGEESSQSPKVKIEQETDDEAVLTGAELVMPSIESPDRDISQDWDADESSLTPTTRSGETHNEAVMTETEQVIPSTENRDRDTSRDFYNAFREAQREYFDRVGALGDGEEGSVSPVVKIEKDSDDEAVLTGIKEVIQPTESPDRDISRDFYNAYQEARREYLNQVGPLSDGEEGSVSPVVKIEKESDDEAVLTGFKEVIQSTESPDRDVSQHFYNVFREAQREYLNQAGPLGNGEESSVSPVVKIEKESDDEAVPAETEEVIQPTESPDRDNSQSSSSYFEISSGSLISDS
ncbi:hypothetical protein FHL15_008220 [Xylaria flabelliformis]|uniref:Uncharacterized protein n=1 Tax=Xylaria flabelliformis TaxID=2512241 RepID=A0A553HS95_9PEZI|nr:hypothetical protein FHL15_008220 [Xylaria flabelliformis]